MGVGYLKLNSVIGISANAAPTVSLKVAVIIAFDWQHLRNFWRISTPFFPEPIYKTELWSNLQHLAKFHNPIFGCLWTTVFPAAASSGKRNKHRSGVGLSRLSSPSDTQQVLKVIWEEPRRKGPTAYNDLEACCDILAGACNTG